jgi:hypothetical protein
VGPRRCCLYNHLSNSCAHVQHRGITESRTPISIILIQWEACADEPDPGRLAPRSGAVSVLLQARSGFEENSRPTAIRGEFWVDFASARQRFEENFARCKSMCDTNFNSQWGHNFSPKTPAICKRDPIRVDFMCDAFFAFWERPLWCFGVTPLCSAVSLKPPWCTLLRSGAASDSVTQESVRVLISLTTAIDNTI